MGNILAFFETSSYLVSDDVEFIQHASIPFEGLTFAVLAFEFYLIGAMEEHELRLCLITFDEQFLETLHIDDRSRDVADKTIRIGQYDIFLCIDAIF